MNFCLLEWQRSLPIDVKGTLDNPEAFHRGHVDVMDIQGNEVLIHYDWQKHPQEFVTMDRIYDAAGDESCALTIDHATSVPVI